MRPNYGRRGGLLHRHPFNPEAAVEEIAAVGRYARLNSIIDEKIDSAAL